MSVSFGALASGLPPDIVDKLIEVERKPIQNMEKKKADLESKKKLVNELKGKINGIKTGAMKDIYSFREMMSVSGDPNIIQATVDKRQAMPATYNIEVVQLARRSSALSTAFPDKDKSQVGVGYIEFELANGDGKSIFIGPDDNTLHGVMNKINNSGLGFVANIIDDGTEKTPQFRLLISGQESGDNKAVKWPQLYFLDGDYDFYIEKERPAQDAKVKIDGFEIEVPENKVSEMIPGVNIDLLQAAPGKEINLTVKEDIETISAKVEDLVKGVNDVLGFIQKQNALTAESNTKNSLGGDITLTNIESRIRSIFTNSIPGAGPTLNYISEIGIGFERSGLLKFDKNKFDNLLNEKFGEVARLFVGLGDGNTGLIPNLKKQLDNFTAMGNGVLSSRESGIINKIRSIDDQIERKETAITKKRAQLKNTFAKLESAVASMKTQSAYVSQAFGNASNGGALGGINMNSAKVS